MKSLFLDTSTNKSVIAIVSDNTILSSIEFLNDKKLSENIFILIDECFKKSKIVPKDIDTIFVVNGPGSFTGVRIGVTIAKTYAWALNKEVIPISTLEAFASTSNDENIVPLIDARRGYVFAGIYDTNLNSKFEDTYIKLDEIRMQTKDNCTYVSLDKFEGLNTIEPSYDIVKLIKKHKPDTPIKPHKLVPNYLKLTEAEEKRKSND